MDTFSDLDLINPYTQKVSLLQKSRDDAYQALKNIEQKEEKYIELKAMKYFDAL